MDKFKHKKSLGQNFLKDEEVLNKIVNAVNLEDDDLVIEIGPGQGALTRKIQQKNVKLLCFEVDERTKPYLEKIKSNNTNIYFQDFLTVDLMEIIKDISYKNLYVIANIPYYITTPIIKKIIDSNINVKNMVLMVQNEVANRFTSNPGKKEYGSITVYLNYYFNVEKLFVVPASCFEPVPKVDSAIIKFSNKEQKYKVSDKEFLFNLIEAAFSQKRKNLRNNLKNYNLEIVNKILGDYGYTLQNRAEELSIEIFVELANALSIN